MRRLRQTRQLLLLLFLVVLCSNTPTPTPYNTIYTSPQRWWQYLSGTGDIKGLEGDPPSDLGRGPRSRDQSRGSPCLSPDQCQMMGMKNRPPCCYFRAEAHARLHKQSDREYASACGICGIMYLKLPQSHLQP